MCGVSTGALTYFSKSSSGDPDPLTVTTEATREEMRDARLPLAYRDSCAHLLIPLNKCRRETWYAPWSCTVRFHSVGCRRRRSGESMKALEQESKFANLSRAGISGRATRLREMPVRRVQEASGQDERAAGVKRGRAKQLRCWKDEGTKCIYYPCMRNGNRRIFKEQAPKRCTACFNYFPRY
jgi:hypothetical protein